MSSLNNNTVINTNYYALWYYFLNGERGTNAISLNYDTLWELHKNTVNNENSMIHNYIKKIIRVSVNRILCYKYNSREKTIELLNEHNNTYEKEGAFYAMQNYPFIDNQANNLFEVLIYLTKEDHDMWYLLSHADNIKYTEDSLYPKFFYEELISLNPITPDEYYEDGIMNA
uniref:Uncharacterized protein n=1 Tax=viral metagenome TaxID=1070528 RepID=A0A6C0IHW9_9ZZZZ